MRPPISGSIKAIVVQAWLEGKTRDQIAVDNGLSAGTITNIINERRSNLGYPVAEDLRELAVTLRKLRMDPSRCALGARIASMMKILGLDEEEFDQFMSIIYKDCITLGIKPNQVAYNLKELLDLCQHTPLPEIPNYIQQQKTQKRKLEQELQELYARVLHARNRVDDALKEERTTRHDLNFRRELWKQQIPMDEISQFLEALGGIRKHGFDPATVVSKYRNFLERDAGKIAIEELRKEMNTLQEQVDAHRLVISEFEQLKSMGFGLKELKQLTNTVKEIAEANGLSSYGAMYKFFSDIENHYDEKLGFELKLENLKSELEENELRKATTQNNPYRFDWSSFFSLLQGRDGGHVQTNAPESQQQTRTNSDGVDGTPHQPICNDANKQERGGKELYKDSEQIQQPNKTTSNIDSAFRSFVSNTLAGKGADSSNFLNYENSKYGLKLQYPSDWFYDEHNSIPSDTPLSPQVIVTFMSLKSLQQQAIASLGIGFMNLTSRKITLDDLTRLNLNILKQSYPGFRLIGSNSTTLFGSNQASELVYSVGGEKKHRCTLFTIIADKVYIISYELHSEYPTYLSIAQKMVNSIEFLSPTTVETTEATNQRNRT